MKRKLILIAVLAAIVAMMVTACGGDDSGGSGGEAAPVATQPGNQPAATTPGVQADGERPVLTIGVQSSIIAEDFETNWMTRYINGYPRRLSHRGKNKKIQQNLYL